jgi:hypothetical protein
MTPFHLAASGLSTHFDAKMLRVDLYVQEQFLLSIILSCNYLEELTGSKRYLLHTGIQQTYH